MIKKITFIILATCLPLCFYCQVQKDFKPEWNIGVGFGPTLSSVDFVKSNAGATYANSSLR